MANKQATAAKRPTVGQRIVQGLDEAIAWSSGRKTGARLQRFPNRFA